MVICSAKLLTCNFVSGEDITKRKDGSITKSIILKGKGSEMPNDGALCSSKCYVIYYQYHYSYRHLYNLIYTHNYCITRI